MNGLDPEGIRWIRTLLQRFAAEGRTVVVSSHLMREMEETADHVIVIGRGRLIADTSIAEFTLRGAGNHVHVVSPDAAALGALLERAGGSGSVSAGADGALTVAGLAAPRIGDLAAEHGLRVHELTPRRASLEAAFMELTEDSVDYRPGGAGVSPFSATLRSEWRKIGSLRPPLRTATGSPAARAKASAAATSSGRSHSTTAAGRTSSKRGIAERRSTS